MHIVPIITPAELAQKLDVHPRTLRRWWERGELPEPLRIGPRRLAWPAPIIHDWLVARGLAEAAEETQEVTQ